MTQPPDEREAIVRDRKAFINWLLWDEGDPQKNEDLSFAVIANIRKQLRERGGIATWEIFKLIADAYERGDHLSEQGEG